MESSSSPLNSDINISFGGSIAPDSCPKVHKIADLLNRLTLFLLLNIITPEILALGGNFANSHALNLF